MLVGLLTLVPFFGTSQTVEKACFSVPGGFYEESFALELSPIYPQHHIRFTTNGNRPTAQSQRYAGPLLLDESLYSTSDLYTIQISTDEYLYVPDSLRHCIVIRAAVFDENDSCISGVTTNSYFVHSLGCDTHGLPAVSLCSDSLDLFDYHRGILVPGIYFDSLNPLVTGNYYQTGSEWERLTNFEYHEVGQESVNQLAGLRVQGKKSRRFEQKAFKLFAREEYGNNRFEHRFFETLPNDSYKHLILKPFYASFNRTGVNDYLASHIASELDVESLASRPVVLFLNGEYWGIYFLHEKPDERFLQDHLGIDPDLVTILDGWSPSVDCGDPTDYIELFRWMTDADLRDPEAYAYLSTKIDLHNFIDYYVLELFLENTDWPANNMRCWQYGNGKWRWVFFDGDACLCWVTFNAFDNAVYEGADTWPSSTRATLFFRKLLSNESFRQQFESRFQALMGTFFSYENTEPMFEEIKSLMEREIPFQSERFGRPVDVDDWNTNMGHTQWFLMKRNEYLAPVLADFMQYWSVGETPLACLEVFPNPSEGPITIRYQADHPETVSVLLYDVTGRQVFAQSLSAGTGDNLFLLTPSLAPGLYLMRVGTTTFRVIFR